MSTSNLITVATVPPAPIHWLWPGYIPAGKTVVVDGDPGLGKSMFTLDIAARISAGLKLPDGQRSEVSGDVVLLSAEDDISQTIRPRLTAHGADLGRVHVLDSVRDEITGEDRDWVLPGDIELLRENVEELDAALVVIDPLMAYLHSSKNSYRDQDVRHALRPVSRMADETGTTVLLVRHLRKSPGMTAVQRGGGSIGIIGAARAGLLIAAHPSGDGRRVMAVSKLNVGKEGQSLGFHLEDSENGAGRVRWDGPVALTANQLAAIPEWKSNDSTQERVAQVFLDLTEESGWVLAAEARSQAEALLGVTVNDKMMQRARQIAGLSMSEAERIGEARYIHRLGVELPRASGHGQ